MESWLKQDKKNFLSINNFRLCIAAFLSRRAIDMQQKSSTVTPTSLASTVSQQRICGGESARRLQGGRGIQERCQPQPSRPRALSFLRRL